jgi:hypothetical protein
MVRMTIALPRSLRDRITALGTDDMRSPQNMALLLLTKAVADAEAVKGRPKSRGRGVAKFDASGDPFVATDTSTPSPG